MKNATMLYKSPGPHEIHGGHYDYIVIDADEEGAIDAAKADGWFETTIEAKEAGEAAKAKREAELNAPPTRAELEAKAKELSIQFSKKTTDDELGKLIQAKLEG